MNYSNLTIIVFSNIFNGYVNCFFFFSNNNNNKIVDNFIEKVTIQHYLYKYLKQNKNMTELYWIVILHVCQKTVKQGLIILYKRLSGRNESRKLQKQLAWKIDLIKWNGLRKKNALSSENALSNTYRLEDLELTCTLNTTYE